MRNIGLGVAIAVAICVFFFIGAVTLVPHDQNPFARTAAVGVGFFSALCWGMSIIGSHIGAKLTVISDAKWNSIFNFFAAGFAATAVGYTYIPGAAL